MLSGEWDSYALEREQEERIQKRLFQKEREKGNNEYISSFFGDLLDKKSESDIKPIQRSTEKHEPTTPISSIRFAEQVEPKKQIFNNPDLTILNKKDESPKAIYKSAEIELLKMRATGDVDHNRLSAIIQELM
ncbi:MAG: hypothetical protein A2Y40_08105 [Candidatus Margulisbacteria bacterium GWF2_35_9]|nr:MAG: hypothetical protein A2Y40_08105 [Candidatus Margulisbacteria bacterium GWF2_35_9]